MVNSKFLAKNKATGDGREGHWHRSIEAYAHCWSASWPEPEQRRAKLGAMFFNWKPIYNNVTTAQNLKPASRSADTLSLVLHRQTNMIKNSAKLGQGANNHADLSNMIIYYGIYFIIINKIINNIIIIIIIKLIIMMKTILIIVIIFWSFKGKLQWERGSFDDLYIILTFVRLCQYRSFKVYSLTKTHSRLCFVELQKTASK